MSEKNKTHQAALQMLSRRDYSHQELSQKLAAKGFPETEIAAVIERLKACHLLNESRFAENLIEWRRKRGYGPKRIQQELKARGIPDEIIAEHLKITDNAWLISVRQVWQKQFKGRRIILLNYQN